jgi:hypothetical protein
MNWRHKNRLIGQTSIANRLFSVVLGLMLYFSIDAKPGLAQVRGVYPLGMSATNSGVTPESGFSYANQFLTYSRSQLKDAEGVTQTTGNNSVVMDMNSIVWVSPKEILAGAKLSLSATLPVAKNSLTSDVTGPISGGSGFADSYYQPFILAWETKSAAVRAAYGFLAPTGSFDATKNDNVGSGYWTHVVSSGQTFFLSADKATAVSIFQMYEFHTTQNGTTIHPGQNLDLDYSVTRTIPAGNSVRVQIGLVGYGQWQTTDKSGSSITPQQAGDHYDVNAVGFATNVVLPSQKLSVGFKYFQEFSNRSTFQGHSVQIAGSIKF